MIKIGIDLIEIGRIERILSSNKNFLKFVMGDREFIWLSSCGFLARSVAANFCGKEAFLKSVGLGIGTLKLKDIQVIRCESGAPVLEFSGKARDYVDKLGCEFSLSLTHTVSVACAVVVGSKN
ncbi:MAG: holo-ACP synthase [Oscillospiraceae bacterium]|nr:holo-ACP synthase [Oscillospiraceae bacterium]